MKLCIIICGSASFFLIFGTVLEDFTREEVIVTSPGADTIAAVSGPCQAVPISQLIRDHPQHAPPSTPLIHARHKGLRDLPPFPICVVEPRIMIASPPLAPLSDKTLRILNPFHAPLGNLVKVCSICRALESIPSF